MNAYVHYALTRRWAAEAGFSERESEQIARADIGVDAARPGGLFHLSNWSYHYRAFGADRLARRGLRRAVMTGSLQDLGVALHRTQDSVAHGWLGLLSHVVYPWVDVWERRSRRVQAEIERRSRGMLADVARARNGGRRRFWLRRR
jgi:hypothetical protein